MPRLFDSDAPVLTPVWDFLVRVLGTNHLSHPLFFIVPVIVTVLVAGLAFSFMDAFVSKKLPFGETAKYLLITLPGYVAVFVILEWIPAPYRVEVPRAAPTLFAFFRDLAVCFVVGDLLSYAWHRLEHGSRFVFRNVHYVHHAVKSPLTVWSGFYVHPVESACVFTTFYIFPFVMQTHPLVFGVYAAMNTFITMVTHCGYELPFYPKWLFASAPMHEHHHAGPRPVNFCVLLSLGDRLFGTYKAA